MTKKIKRKKTVVDVRNCYRYQFFGSAELFLPNDNVTINTTIANISMTGIGLYSNSKIGKAKKVKLNVAFVDSKGKMSEETVEGKVDWQKKFKNIYLIGIMFDEELNMKHHPKLLGHLLWLIDTYQWPQPYIDKRIVLV